MTKPSSNPLPASFEISLRDPGDYMDVATYLRGQGAVESVQDIQKTVSQMTSVINVVSTIGIVVLVIVGLTVLFIIVNTIRLAVVARSEEIEIMRLHPLAVRLRGRICRIPGVGHNHRLITAGAGSPCQPSVELLQRPAGPGQHHGRPERRPHSPGHGRRDRRRWLLCLRTQLPETLTRPSRPART